jgi:hypothetical protein
MPLTCANLIDKNRAFYERILTRDTPFALMTNPMRGYLREWLNCLKGFTIPVFEYSILFGCLFYTSIIASHRIFIIKVL